MDDEALHKSFSEALPPRPVPSGTRKPTSVSSKYPIVRSEQIPDTRYQMPDKIKDKDEKKNLY